MTFYIAGHKMFMLVYIQLMTMIYMSEKPNVCCTSNSLVRVFRNDSVLVIGFSQLTGDMVVDICIFWYKCCRIPFRPSFIRGLCNFWTATRCQKKNHITQFGGCVRCSKLASKPSYRSDLFLFLLFHLPANRSTFTTAQ